MLLLPVASLLGCAPERPDYINRSTHKEGSPTVLIVGTQKTTRDDIEKEIQAMPIWLQSRFDSTDGTAIFAESLLSRGLLFRAAQNSAILNDPSVMTRYESNVLDGWLRAQTLLPPPTDDERRQYLTSPDGRRRFQTRDIYQIVVASKSAAEAIAENLKQTPDSNRHALFTRLVARHSLDPTITWRERQRFTTSVSGDVAKGEGMNDKLGLVATVSRDDYAKIRDPEPPTLLENPPIKVGSQTTFVDGILGPLNLDAPTWEIEGPYRDAVMWKIYMLGAWNDVDEGLKDPNVVAKIDEQVLLQRRIALVKKITEAPTP